MKPFGEYVSQAGKTTIKINIDQTVKIYFPNNELDEPIFEGRFTNFDELKGTEFHNFANPIDVESKNKKQAGLMFHIAEDCSLMKGGPNFRDVGEKIKIDDALFWNTNQKYEKSD